MNCYNEHDLKAAAWLHELMKARLIPDGHIDTRSIKDVTPSDLFGFTQCHFFCGIGGWPLSFRLSGWPDSRKAWSGSCPCQPHSAAANIHKKGFEDPRDLWPHWFSLIKECEPDVVFGEQVDDSVAWIDRMHADMETAGYAIGALDLPACAVNAPQERMRTFFVGDANGAGFGEQGGTVPMAPEQFCTQRSGSGSCFGDHYTTGELGRNRRHEPSIRLLAHGVPHRVGRLRGYGNAIVPQVAAEFIKAFMQIQPAAEAIDKGEG